MFFCLIITLLWLDCPFLLVLLLVEYILAEIEFVCQWKGKRNQYIPEVCIRYQNDDIIHELDMNIKFKSKEFKH